MVQRNRHSKLSRETVRRRLAENEFKPWRKEMWCVPKVDAEYVARTEEVLDLYTQPADPTGPVVCFDESPTHRIGEARTPVPAKRGQLERCDYQYRRKGTVNVFVFLDAHRPWRHIKMADQRTAQDFAECMRDLVDVHYLRAKRIRVVLDNLSTHSAAALYRSFTSEEARRILRRLELHQTPEHASWLNRVEIEIGVLRARCLDRRIGERARLESEVQARQQHRNDVGARVRWMFTPETARAKMGHANPRRALGLRGTCPCGSRFHRGMRVPG